MEDGQTQAPAEAAEPMPRGGALCLARACRADLEVSSGHLKPTDLVDYVWVLSEPPRQLDVCPGASVQPFSTITPATSPQQAQPQSCLLTFPH